MEMCCSAVRGVEKERIQTRLGQRTSPDEHKKAGTEPHPQRRTAIQRYSDVVLRCEQNGCWSNGEGGLPAINWLAATIDLQSNTHSHHLGGGGGG